MRRPDARSWWLLAAIGGVIYPALVYYYFDKMPPAFFCLIALGLIGTRIIVTGRRAEGHFWLPVLLVAGATMTMVLFIDARLAVKIYPILMSLSVASVFALSLRHPPTVIERLARIRAAGDLSPGRHCLYTKGYNCMGSIPDCKCWRFTNHSPMGNTCSMDSVEWFVVLSGYGNIVRW